ncbi:excinuclease ABC subunit UvrC [bacterium]|nr:MAG: excinuclease ABC subunit UvrC [bacterium]
MAKVETKLKDKLSDVPRKPGVYKFLDKDGVVLYVGKAKNLRVRLGQYFSGHDTRVQLPYLIAEAADFDYIIVGTELESLFLENTLIKEHMPAYNIMLRDDKNYAFIQIDYSCEIPQITYARKVTTDKKSKFFGPYSSAKKIRQTLDLTRKIFPFCSNSQVGKRPCFYYFLHRCPGVCIGEISLQEYKQQLERISTFLSGKTAPIKKELQSQMKQAARGKRFELAARLRDQYQAIEILDEKQITMFAKKVSWDFISIFSNDLSAAVNLFKVREGKLKDNEQFIFDNILGFNPEYRAQAIMQSFLENYYAQATDLPTEIYIQTEPNDSGIVSKLLQSRSKKKVILCLPTRGPKLKLINLGKVNAEEFLLKWQRNQATNVDAIKETLEELKKLLKLPNTPRRIEGYDISNTQGTNPVGSMVVIKDGQPAKSEYRKFKITRKQTPDDFLMMREMLERRLSRIKPDNEKDAWPIPDLLVIDGGKGQLGVVVEVLKQKKLDIPVIGLAKRIEEIFLPHSSDPIALPHDNPVLQMLQRLRDEAHRFGITFHKSLRSKQAVRSALDTIPGIGPKTKKLLKQKIGTVEQIRRAPIEELEQLLGKTKAQIVKSNLQ